jgi:predicted metal-dependent HD superfamily phosphohydrolase
MFLKKLKIISHYLNRELNKMNLTNISPLANKFWREGLELQGRWFRLCDNLGFKFNYESEESGETNLSFEFEQLFYKYSEGQRYYHTPKHLLECLNEFDQVKSLVNFPNQTELALWFHDVVYNPEGKDNEEKSKEYALKVLSNLGLNTKTLEQVGNLVLLTKHQVNPPTIDEKILLDIDLSIFGKSKEVFDEYEMNIRKEYSWATEKEFKGGRSKILQYFLNRDSIYATDYFKARYEMQARVNLERSLGNLK